MWTKRKLSVFLLAVITSTTVATMLAPVAGACGGLFCDNTPVSQSGERIIFTVNDDATVSALIQIQYFGSAEDFSWILPIPEAISADAIQVPDRGDRIFNELHRLTDVQILPPRRPECQLNITTDAATATIAPSDSASDEAINIFASGEIGPFGFDVIGADDPDALVRWLRDNNYRVDPPMEPLIDVYVEQQFAFVAMRLLDGETADSIQPIEITYPGTNPMIPLQLTAVAALPQMPVWVWIFADAQAVPENYDHMEIATEELTFGGLGSNDYTQLVQGRADALGGRAFITEFAGPSQTLASFFTEPYLIERVRNERYLTRLNTYISPAEMTVDPVFRIDSTQPDVSNIRDAREMTGLYACERELAATPVVLQTSDAINPRSTSGQYAAVTPVGRLNNEGTSIPLGVALGGAALAISLVLAFVEFNGRKKTI